ncbi:MAG: hypothetical protein V3T70_04895, partial [Phycisphaerae bacterium]
SLGLGMFLALCSLHSAQKTHTVVMILVPLCALGYPIFDMMLAVARRMLRGQPLWSSDRDHIHHRLLARGQSPSQAAATIYAASLLVIIACIAAMSSHHLAVGLAIGGFVVLAIFIVRVLGYIELGGWSERKETKILHAAAQLARLKLQSAVDAESLLAGLAVFAAGADLLDVTVRNAQTTHRWTASNADGGAQSIDTAMIPLAEGWSLEVRAQTAILSDPDRRSLLDELARTAERSVAQWGAADHAAAS